MASKNGGNVAVDPSAALKAKQDRVSAIDEILRKTAPSVTLIKEQVEKSAREPWALDADSILSEILPEGTDQSKAVALYDVLITVTKSVREIRDSFVEEAVKSEIAKRQTSADAKKLESLKSERARLATEYETLRNACGMLGISTEGFNDLERAPKVALSIPQKRGPRANLDGYRIVYAIDGENEDKYALSQVAFMSTQGIKGTGTKLNTDEFLALVAKECNGADARKDEFRLVVKFHKQDGSLKRTKVVTGRKVEIPADAPAATE